MQVFIDITQLIFQSHSILVDATPACHYENRQNVVETFYMSCHKSVELVLNCDRLNRYWNLLPECYYTFIYSKPRTPSFQVSVSTTCRGCKGKLAQTYKCTDLFWNKSRRWARESCAHLMHFSSYSVFVSSVWTSTA